MKLISWNVNGIRACINKGFKEFFKEIDADIFCIQETKCQPEQIELEFEGYKSYYNSAERKGYSGTAIYTKIPPINVFYGILIPFLGTSAGAACVFFMKKNLNEQIQRALTGFAAGVMVAASIWSLLIPAIEQSSGLGKLSFVPAAVGFWIGVLFLLLLDHMIPHLHQNSNKAEGPKSKLQRTTMLVLAVTLHNIPEGMAVGVVYAGYLTGHAQITIMGAMALSIGIAIQNFPEGAIISMPLRSEGMGKTKAFAGGVLSGIVEPVGAVLTILAAGLIVPALPYLLSFAAGAMLYVVVEELIPEMSAGEHSNIGTIFFAVGFSLMMILDVALG